MLGGDCSQVGLGVSLRDLVASNMAATDPKLTLEDSCSP